MNNLRNRIRAAKAEDGFTLIELLVVILILGILAAIVVVALSGSSQDARTKACSQDTGNVYNALNNYVLHNGDLPVPSMTLTNTLVGGSSKIPGANNSFDGTKMSVAVYNTFPNSLTGKPFGELGQLVPGYISKIPDDVAVYYIEYPDPANVTLKKFIYAVGPNFNTDPKVATLNYATTLPPSPLSAASIAGCSVAGL